jgi:hypothetical protein
MRELQRCVNPSPLRTLQLARDPLGPSQGGSKLVLGFDPLLEGSHGQSIGEVDV